MDFTKIPSDAVSLIDYERLSMGSLDGGIAAYLQGGAADEITLAENTRSWQVCGEEPMVPRILRKREGARYSCELFGKMLKSPVLIAPTAYHRLFHTEGELSTAAAAQLLGVPYVVSTQASISLEEIAASSSGSPLWFQLYIQPDREFTADLVKRAEAAGYEAIVLTVDAPLSGIRNAEQRAGFSLPSGVRAVNLDGMKRASNPISALDPGFLSSLPSWEDISWLKQITDLPVLLKGVLHPDDAVAALEHGVDGLIVSNHGGRTLDQVISTRAALPDIVSAVAGRVPVLVDGGIRRGTDVLQALRLGADAVLLGRPILQGLHVAGAAGVFHVLKLIQHEFEVAVLLSGLDPRSAK